LDGALSGWDIATADSYLTRVNLKKNPALRAVSWDLIEIEFSDPPQKKTGKNEGDVCVRVCAYVRVCARVCVRK